MATKDTKRAIALAGAGASLFLACSVMVFSPLTVILGAAVFLGLACFAAAAVTILRGQHR